MFRVLPAYLVIVLLTTGCQPGAEEQPRHEPQADRRADVSYVSYGEEISEDDPAISTADIFADLNAYNGTAVRVEGEIVQVCRQQGCWLTLDNPVGEPLRVHVAKNDAGDYLWTVPTDLGRHVAIVEGTVYVDTLSVDDQRHYLEDGGATQEDIDAIAEARPSAYITAAGLLIEEHELAPAAEGNGSADAEHAPEPLSD